MKSRQLIVAVAVFAAAGSVFAGDVAPFGEQDHFVSTKTREQVRDELSQARAQGLLIQGDYWEGQTSGAPSIGARGPAGARASVRTREEVRTELKEYLKTNKNSPPDYTGE